MKFCCQQQEEQLKHNLMKVSQLKKPLVFVCLFTDNYNYSSLSILSPLSQSSSYSVDSGYSGLMEQSGSPPSQSLTYQQTAPLNHNNAGSHHIMQAYSDFNGNFFVKTPFSLDYSRMHLFIRHKLSKPHNVLNKFKFTDHDSFHGSIPEFYGPQVPVTIDYSPFLSPPPATVPTNIFSAGCTKRESLVKTQ